MLVAAVFAATAAFSDDSVKPERVRMTEHALTTVQARAAQKAWADHLGVEAIFENSVGMQFCVIPPGTFLMGDDYGKGWKGRLVVKHSQPYFIGRYEVTRSEWERVMGSFHGQPKVGAGDRLPRIGINYAEAAARCERASRIR